MTKKETFQMIAKIVKRAEGKELLMFDRMSLIMDIQAAHEEFNLRLEDFLKSDDLNFVHDIIGIQNNLNRRTKEMENLFVPIFAQ